MKIIPVIAQLRERARAQNPPSPLQKNLEEALVFILSEYVNELSQICDDHQMVRELELIFEQKRQQKDAQKFGKLFLPKRPSLDGIVNGRDPTEDARLQALHNRKLLNLAKSSMGGRLEDVGSEIAMLRAGRRWRFLEGEDNAVKEGRLSESVGILDGIPQIFSPPPPYSARFSPHLLRLAPRHLY